MEEIFLPVPNFEGLYDLSNKGQLYSYPRPYCKGGYTYGNDNGDGYLQTTLSKNSIITCKRINRLVWETFVGPIPKGYDVHHIDGNRKNNSLENLSLINTHTHCKMHYEEKKEKLRKACVDGASKPVLQFSKNGQFVAEYPSISEASKQTGIHISNISHHIKDSNNRKSAGGFIWRYKNNGDSNEPPIS